MKKEELTPLHILVVDDDDNVRMILNKALTKLGHHVSLEKTAEEALSALQRSHFHVVITDIQMAEMTGVELLREIKELNPLIQVYVITAHSNLEYVIQCMKGGAYDYFEKPIKIDNIIRTINEAARRVSRWNALYKKHSSM
ncbi:MAG: response regulator [SAR324 cluster bacterium]|nr:response regulator [SAR324 cluster bacterium]